MKNREAVVLIHGIWMNSLEMLYLKRHFQKLDYAVYGFDYPSLRRSPVQNAHKLKQFIDTLEQETVHLVAHSLGGVVVMHLFDQFADIKPGRIVLMGCPYRGSAVAQQVKRRQRGWHRLLLGEAQRGALLQSAPEWRGQRELGVLAGNNPMGMGTLLGAIEGQAHDGTVHVRETVIDTAKDFTVLPVSHTSMLFNPVSATAVSHFLSHGRFPV